MKSHKDFRSTATVLVVLLAVLGASTLFVSSRSAEVVQAQPIVPETMKMKLALTQELLEYLALKDFQQMKVWHFSTNFYINLLLMYGLISLGIF